MSDPAPTARDLLVSAYTPVLRSGRALRTYGLARALAMRGNGLDLLYARFEAPEPDAAFRAIPGIALHEVIPSRGARRLLAYARARAGGFPAAVTRGVSPELTEQAANLARARDRGHVIADGPVVAAALAGLARRRPVIYNAHNFESGFRHELEGAPRAHGRQWRRFERGLLAHASESWMVSEPDLVAAHELCPTARLRLVPNVLDVAAIEPLRTLTHEPRAIFVANFAYAPNRNGLRFLLAEVLPRVWEELPDATLTLVGAGLESGPSLGELQELIGDPRVEVLGFVEDLREAYARARCAVVPLLQGGGTPLKLLEALAYGLPTVVTPRATAGLAVRDGEHCLIADGAEAFAAALRGALRDGLPELGLRGRKLVLDRYSIEALGRMLSA
jgi:glycosyltransferase involved in cell wall biosynthesis